MSSFARIENADGTVATFEVRDTDLVQAHGGERAFAAAQMRNLEPIATAVSEVAQRLRTSVTPDEVAIEIGIALSAEVGWFVARSQVEGSVKLTLTWKGSDAE